MTPEAIARRRLAAQFLTVPGPAKAADVVRRLGAVQAQDYAGSKWALSQRTSSAADDHAIEEELTAGAFLRTHVLRQTWHFVAPEDLRWMLALTAPRVSRAMAYYNRKLELTPAVFRRSHAAITRVLRDGRHLTRAELGAVLARARLGVVSGQRLGHFMAQAELDAVVCSGARRGKQFTYALLDERVPAGPAMDRDQALAELARRYFPTRGPASAHDFAWWSGLAPADARRAVEILGRELERVDVNGTTAWMSARAAPPPRRPRAHLLPNYDEYFIGLKDRGAIGQRLGSVQRVTGGSAMAHVVVVDGQLVGGWKRSAAGPALVVQLELLTPLHAVERRLIAREVARYRDFAAVPVEVRGL